MKSSIDISELIDRIESIAPEHSLLLAILKLKREHVELRSFIEKLAGAIEYEVVRSVYTPNSEVMLFELRRKGLSIVILVVESEEEGVVSIEKTTDQEIAEIEANIYSSNINDLYIRLVSDIF